MQFSLSKKLPERRLKILRTTALLLVAVGLFATPRVEVPWLDSIANAYFSDTIVKAGVSYGSLRAVNAALSPVKGSSFEIHPAGLGVTVAAGMALDPLDKLVEQTASVFIAAITSLGVQRIAYDLSVVLAPLVIGLCILLFLATSWWKKSQESPLNSISVKIIVIAVALRLCLPISGLISNALDKFYFADKISAVQMQIESDTPANDEVEIPGSSEDDGFFQGLIDKYDRVKDGFKGMTSKIQAFSGKANNLIQNVFRITFLYMTLFFIQVIVIPVGAFLILIRLSRSLLEKDIPMKNVPGGRIFDKLDERLG